MYTPGSVGNMIPLSVFNFYDKYFKTFKLVLTETTKTYSLLANLFAFGEITLANIIKKKASKNS